jgi:hypothetical protein
VENVSQAAAEQKSLVESEAGRLDEAITTFTTAFEQAQTERDERFTSQAEGLTSQLKAALDESSESVDSAVKATQDSLAGALDELKEKSDAAWAEISALQQRAQAASNYLGINSVAGGYHQTADVEERRAFRLRLAPLRAFSARSARPSSHSSTTSSMPSRSTAS